MSSEAQIFRSICPEIVMVLAVCFLRCTMEDYKSKWRLSARLYERQTLCQGILPIPTMCIILRGFDIHYGKIRGVRDTGRE
ncbi:hypothetical protein [Desulfosporosinus fructosivorans]